jgi:Cys-tRNA(Pro)/Cys-tRNA(Cys) deacylase
MAKKSGKTLAMRVLEGKKVPYQVLTFSPGVHSAGGVAEALGLPPEEVYKTLVVVRPLGKPLLVMVAANQELDLKRLARAVGEKKLKMATHREAEALTALKVGGISALALLNKGFHICILREAQALSHIVVSAGRRGVDLRLAVEDLIKATGPPVTQEYSPTQAR